MTNPSLTLPPETIEFDENQKRTKLEANNIVLSRGNLHTFKSKSYKILEMNNFTDLE